jgi:predicted metalloprotease
MTKLRRVVAAWLALAVAPLGLAAAASSAASAAPRAATPKYQRTLEAAIADLQAYWSAEFPQLYGGQYTPIGKIVAAGPGVRIPDCQGKSMSYRNDVEGNAFYCFRSNFITYDGAELFPQLAKNFGAFAPALVLAHEWGHAIQDRAQVDRANEPTVYVELQADCFAGSWVQRIANGDSPTMKFSPGDLDNALAAYLEFRDAVGTDPNDKQSHGNAFDRVNAFQTGVDGGAEACKPFFDSPPPVTEQGLTAQQAKRGTNLPAQQVLPATLDTLGEYYSQVAPDVAVLTLKRVFKYHVHGAKQNLPKCGGSRVSVKQATDRVFYCLPDGYIAFDEQLLDDIYSTIGDFGVSALIASAYATHVQYGEHLPGVAANTVDVVLGADCDTGSWAGYLEQATLNGRGVPAPSLKTTLTLAPDDLDKVIQAFLVYDARRGVSQDADFLFRRLEAFRLGFFNGYASCQPTAGSS